jgi:hypothetical protein
MAKTPAVSGDDTVPVYTIHLITRLVQVALKDSAMEHLIETRRWHIFEALDMSMPRQFRP